MPVASRSSSPPPTPPAGRPSKASPYRQRWSEHGQSRPPCRRLVPRRAEHGPKVQSRTPAAQAYVGKLATTPGGAGMRNLNTDGAWWAVGMLLVVGVYLVYRFFGS
jgi:hypothetical protein